MSEREPKQKRSLAAALAALLRPLEFALKDEAASLARVPALEKTLARACDGLAVLALPADCRQFFETLSRDLLAERAADDRIPFLESVWERLKPIRAPDWAGRMLARPTSVLQGVGPKRAESLARRGIHCVGDLLFQLPSRYEDRRQLSRIQELEVGHRVTFIGQVILVDFLATRFRGRSRQVLQAVVGDDRGTINLKWFRGGESIARSLKKDDRLLITGDVKRYRFSKEIVHPEIERLDPAGAAENTESERGEGPQIVPLYTAPEGVNPRTLRRLVQDAVREYSDLVTGFLPNEVIREYGFPSASDALRQLHWPPDGAEFKEYEGKSSPAYQRLVLEELYLLELGLALRRQRESKKPGIALEETSSRIENAKRALPFQLTKAQSRCWQEIVEDLKRPHPMNRLLQGDVGSGKTVVALLAALAASYRGYQTALMAPTELLAEQHSRTLRNLVGAGGELCRLEYRNSQTRRPGQSQLGLNR